MLKRRPGGRGAPRERSSAPTPNFNKGWTHVICVGGGPSLSHEQCMQAAAARLSGWKVITINNSWERIPTADALYACDDTWWGFYKRKLEDFEGERWTPSLWAAHKHGLQLARTYAGAGLHREVGCTYSGSNSGHQVLNLAYHFGAERVVLIGYDMQRTYGMSHWHGDHPPELERPMPIDTWVEGMNLLAADLAEAGVLVTNATLETALTCFPRAPLEVALCR